MTKTGPQVRSRAELMAVADLGHAVFDIIQAHAWTYDELAVRLGCSKRYAEDIMKWVQGKPHPIGIKAAMSIAEDLGVGCVCLVGEEANEILSPRPIPRIASPSIVPALADLSQVAA